VNGHTGHVRRHSVHRRRFWVEVGLFVTSAVLFLVTVVWPAWIELVFGADPDRGDGLAEWAIAAGALATAVAFSLAAYVEWRRPAVIGAGSEM
jgi:hypothetical protein